MTTSKDDDIFGEDDQNPGIGHNSAGAEVDDFDEDSDEDETTGGVAKARLKSFCERIERLAEERKEINEDIKEVKAEAKAVGFDIKTINKMLVLRAKDPEKRREEDELEELYRAALDIL